MPRPRPGSRAGRPPSAYQQRIQRSQGCPKGQAAASPLWRTRPAGACRDRLATRAGAQGPGPRQSQPVVSCAGRTPPSRPLPYAAHASTPGG
eukprot:2980760-Lingulodinium_polyedra.AAC.1